MKIGELAAQAGCDVQTLRFYEREGLLDEPVREASGYRRYDEQALVKVRFIRHCRSLDIPLQEVRQLLALAAQPGHSCSRVDGLLDERISLVRQRIQELRALEKQLVSLRKSCDGDASHPCAILEAFRSAPQSHACACHAARCDLREARCRIAQERSSPLPAARSACR